MRESQSDVILREADRMLESGLRGVLARYGEPHVIGSYSLRLMTWRDLDIHLVRDELDLPAFFALGGEVATLVKPHRMHFRDETLVRTPGLPKGLYWGVYLGDEKAGAWKIDVWATGREDFESVRRFNDGIAARLTDDARAAILAVKAACWRIRSIAAGSRARMSTRRSSIAVCATSTPSGRICERPRAFQEARDDDG